ncbi:MAG TPA: hypothetical protein VGB50_08460 [Flavobacterium sp.]|jgi:NADH:ubiquinone oxidoreductase subunit 2 (subunit N)
MYKFVLNLHSGWAFIVLIMLVISFINAYAGFASKKAFMPKDRRISLFALIAVHLQFVVGLLLYFTSPNGMQKIQAVGMSGMSAMDRLLALEHPLINLIAVTLITIGWSKHKRAMESTSKFKSLAILYGLGLLLLLSRIPWANWFA